MLGIWGGGPVKFRALRDTPPPTGLCGEAAFPAPHTHSGKGLPRTCSPPSRRQLGFLDVATPSQRLGAAVEGAPRPPPRACFETHLHSRGGRDGAAPGAPTPLASLGEAGAGSEGGARARGCKHRRGKWGRVCVGGGGGGALCSCAGCCLGAPQREVGGRRARLTRAGPLPTGLVAPTPATQIHDLGLLRPHQRRVSAAAGSVPQVSWGRRSCPGRGGAPSADGKVVGLAIHKT